MVVDDWILLVLMSLVVPLVLAIFHHLTEPVPATRHRRRLVSLKGLAPISRILVAQKTVMVLIVSFIGIVRFTGGFPGREWVALGLYLLFVVVAWIMFWYQRRIQLPFERVTRNK